MGSDSDLSIMKEATDILKEFGVEFEVQILSAHRLPKETAAFAEAAEERGLKAIIAGAGGAAHLAGVVASLTIVPVIGVPIMSKSLSGVDSLYSIVQMPKGIPVATVAVNGAANAALLAIHIMALSNADLLQKLKDYRCKMSSEVIKKNVRMQDLGIDGYMLHKGVK